MGKPMQYLGTYMPTQVSYHYRRFAVIIVF